MFRKDHCVLDSRRHRHRNPCHFRTTAPGGLIFGQRRRVPLCRFHRVYRRRSARNWVDRCGGTDRPSLAGRRLRRPWRGRVSLRHGRCGERCRSGHFGRNAHHFAGRHQWRMLATFDGTTYEICRGNYTIEGGTGRYGQRHRQRHFALHDDRRSSHLWHRGSSRTRANTTGRDSRSIRKRPGVVRRCRSVGMAGMHRGV